MRRVFVHSPDGYLAAAFLALWDMTPRAADFLSGGAGRKQKQEQKNICAPGAEKPF